MSKSKLKNKWKPGTLVSSKYDEDDIGIYLGTIQIQEEWYHEVFILDIQEFYRYNTIELNYIWKKATR